jgi:alkyl hydroperoxide reductase subunit AhpC
MKRALIALVLVSALIPSIASADKTQLDPGEDALPFRIKVLNPDKAKIPTFDIQDVVGPEAESKKKLVVMSFFATYCEPCKRELPFLGALYEEYKDQGLQVLSVSIDKEEDKIKVAAELAAQHALSYPVLSDRFQVVAKRYYINKLPCLYFVDGNMKVSKVSIGYDDNASKDILSTVRTALGLPVDAPVPERLQKYIGGKPAEAAPAAKTEEPKEEKADPKKGKAKTKAKPKKG